MKAQSAHTSPEAERVQIALLRQASVARRIRLLQSLTDITLRLSRRALHQARPALEPASVAIAWAELHYGHEVIKRLGVTPREGMMQSAEILAVLTPGVEAFRIHRDTLSYRRLIGQLGVWQHAGDSGCGHRGRYPSRSGAGTGPSA